MHIQCVAEGDSVTSETYVSTLVFLAVVIGWLNKPETCPYLSSLFNKPITTKGDFYVAKATLSPLATHLRILLL